MKKESMEKIEKAGEGIEQQELESKEVEKLPSVFMIYRDNDLFKEQVPKIAETLKGLGRKVEIQAFPAEMPEEEIKKWYLAHKQGLQSSDVLADYTVKRSSGYELKTKIVIDDLLNKSVTEAIAGDATFARRLRDEVREDPENPEKKEEYLSVIGEMYKKLLALIPEKKRQKLEVIILKGISEDLPGFPPLIDHEPFCFDEDRGSKKTSKETDEFAERMKEWFNEAGISNTTVFSTGAEIPAETVEKLTKGQAYIIFDRHTWTSMRDTPLSRADTENLKEFWGKNAMSSGLIKEKSALQTPIETFYKDIQKKIGIEADPQKIEKSIKKELQEKLTKEQEK